MHECPECYKNCFCNGDIESMDWGPSADCTCDCWIQEGAEEMAEYECSSEQKDASGLRQILADALADLDTTNKRRSVEADNG